MFFVNRDWRITYVNTEAQLIWEKSRQELLGQIFWEAFPQVIGTTFEKSYHRAMEQGEFLCLQELGLSL
jgi:hypothetical protein